ncbi:hypothetical protein [Streptomonospora litoralis]|uniref:Uncharacterized protein n=1 Tax=Streptomonospora litoralis TaxID=2498135 RepID=A0A4P6Q161_9ACTN|nr:hypothetical protein [Streptomonospora litoralis]QBI54308.1 hypothetical protein EKD16_12630 [Streptomonospora litoralis]
MTSSERRLRPVIDPDLAAEERDLLAAHPGVLVPATAPAPAPTRDAQPSDRRRIPIVLGLLAALVGIAVLTRSPVLILGCLLLLAMAPAGLSGALRPAAREHPAARAARLRHGRYLLAADFDEPCRALLARAQQAADDATASTEELADTGRIEARENTVVLPRQLWDIATTLRSITDLGDRARIVDPALAEEVADLLAERRAAVETARGAIEARVAALERYAAGIAAAARHQRRLDELRRLLHEQEDYRDLLAATAADEHAAADIDRLAERAGLAEEDLAAALQAALREADLLSSGSSPPDPPQATENPEDPENPA